MKKSYIKPTSECLRVMTEGVMKDNVSIYNDGQGSDSEAPDHAGNNGDSGIDVGAKGYDNWDSVWDD